MKARAKECLRLLVNILLEHHCFYIFSCLRLYSPFPNSWSSSCLFKNNSPVFTCFLISILCLIFHIKENGYNYFFFRFRFHLISGGMECFNVLLLLLLLYIKSLVNILRALSQKQKCAVLRKKRNWKILIKFVCEK